MTTEAPTSARSGGYARGRATREEILDVAMQLFGEVGYRTASLREVASRVGISHPGLLHHFGSKAVLLAAVLERRDEVDDAAFEADLAAGYDYVDAMVRVIERNASRPGIVELFATLSAEATSPDHPAHAWFQDRYRRVLDRGAAEFESRRAVGELRPGLDPLTAARLTVAVMDGMQIQWLLAADTPEARPDMAATLRAHVATLLTS
ncbi:TetR family transcriptional regulator [Cellulomonas sp. Root485]|uniref:TetR/AcrR family transcriptional regulator n=1 Tax=Cellulomonas sp. Root485 TaxID=1736546 RepID=UPI0006F514D9|nr:TetR/AcrR family transcriptional regulator [Cellulomonas sp. Root485]KQY23030.1 TetR family transcriptional regulator [Cellulomonas sp. Root485]